MIRIDISRCTGCKRCETACAFFHTGRINNRLARIKVLNLYETGIDGAVVCTQCKERYCLCCPENALTIGAFGEIIVSSTLCTLCGACEKACPVGAIEIFNELVYVCDLCGGRPKCIEACTEEAITYDKKHRKHLSLAKFSKATKKMNPSQKRHHYLQWQSIELRKKWRSRYA